MTDSTVFIGALVIAITQAIKIVVPKVSGAVTIIVALLVGVLVALLHGSLGLLDISVSQGILIALASVGVHTVASAVNTTPSA